jgi:anaerobic selenocysteine-containing dehydrogenase
VIDDLQTSPSTDALQLFTLRSNDQFNTTIYSYDDRYRGIYGTRKVVLMNTADMRRLGLEDGDVVSVFTVADDGVERKLTGIRATGYDVPEGCCAGYYPECNPLIPWWHHAKSSQTPAASPSPCGS